MEKRHKQYLINRNFDPDKLEKTWDLRGAGYTGDYKFRIIAPIIFKNKIVSFQGRDITGQSTLKYKTCKTSEEAIHHKHILYGIDKVKNRQAVIVEGITDVWRLGEGAVSTFGISYTEKQVLFISKYLDRAFILFDNEPTAQQKAKKLAIHLTSVGVKAEVVNIESNDPAELKQEDADYLMKYLLRKI
jgi:DNA primase